MLADYPHVPAGWTPASCHTVLGFAAEHPVSANSVPGAWTTFINMPPEAPLMCPLGATSYMNLESGVSWGAEATGGGQLRGEGPCLPF